MRFDDWFLKLQQNGWLDVDGRKVVTDLGDKVGDDARDPSSPAVPGPEDIFDALVDRCRNDYSYSSTSQQSLSECLKNQTLDCAKASQLVVGIILYCTGADLSVENVFGFPVNGGAGRVVTPPIVRAGVRIQNNLSGGGGRMFFTGTHAVANIEDDQFDLITGIRRHTIDFLGATTDVYTDNGYSYRCVIDGIQRKFTPLVNKTSENLPTFTVDPSL
jgi:hypothetical protein